MNRDSANPLFWVINYRYGKGAAIAITTNKGIADWPSILARAILDCLLHNATVSYCQ